MVTHAKSTQIPNHELHSYTHKDIHVYIYMQV